jgi:hypothetical protein
MFATSKPMAQHDAKRKQYDHEDTGETNECIVKVLAENHYQKSNILGIEQYKMR